MENILVVIRDEIRKNGEILVEIRDILKERHGNRHDNRSHTEKAIEAVKSDGNDKAR